MADGTGRRWRLMGATPRVLTFTAEDFAQADEERAKAQRRRAKLQKVLEQGGIHGTTAVPVVAEEGVLRAYTMEELAKLPPPNWLVRNVVEEQGLTLFFAPDKMGKTAVLSSMLWAWAAGHDQWLHEDFGMHDPGEGERSVLYVLLEGHSTYYSRYRAWCDVYNKGKPVGNFWTAAQGLALFNSGMVVEDPQTWGESVKELYKFAVKMQPRILVVDTLARATAGMDENSSQMSQIVAFFDLLRDSFGTSTVVVHHTPLDDNKRPRGHSSLKGAASSYVRISDSDGPNKRVKTLWHGPHRNAEGSEHGYDFTFHSTPESFYVGAVDTRSEVKMTTREAEIVQFLRVRGGSATQAEIQKELNMDRGYMYELIDRSIFLEKVEGGRNKSIVVRVVESDEPDEL